MPGSAAATGLADYVLTPSEMPGKLLNFRKQARKAPVGPEEKLDNKTINPLQRILTLIRAHTGHDFSLYKQNTILRRVERRMTIHQIEDLADYATFLRNNTHEIDILFKELLIRVTNFFRDKDAFEILREKILPVITKNKSYENPVRVWVAGCSTGEEAYSLAIMLHEYAQGVKNNYKVQIFATDIDSSAIDIARVGSYPDNIAVDVSPERLSRYFVKKGNTYKIKDEIREMVVFSLQNVTRDPPFSRIDLISCRNLLIYLGAALQKKVLPVFRYALNPGGALFLGSSENVGDSVDAFSVIDKKWKIFQARKEEPLPPAAVSTRHAEQIDRGLRPEGGRQAAGPEVLKINQLTEKLLLDQYSPPCAIVNENGDILYIHGRTGKYLEPASGRATLNIFEMARDGLRLDLRTALRRAVHGKKNIKAEHIRVKTNGAYELIDLDVNYIATPENLQGLVMVVFNPVAHPKEEKPGTRKAGSEKKSEARLSELEFELKSTKEHLQTTIEELETSNEELKATNEELQSSNEELQSTNEELETSKEELQSVNEELMTVNAELQSKLDDLTEINNDMTNLVASTRIATMFLNNDLRIKSFTPEAVKVFSLIETDIGRPITDIASRLEYPDLLADIREVIRTLAQKEKTVRHLENRWYIIRILPYRTLNNVIDGAVITFVDITDRKLAEERVEAALAYSRGVIETVREPLIVLDSGLKVISANKSFYRTFGVSSAETEGKVIYDLGNGQWDIPKLRELLEKILPESTEFSDCEVEHDFPGIGLRKMLLNARRITQEGAKTETILLAIEDVTGK